MFNNAIHFGSIVVIAEGPDLTCHKSGIALRIYRPPQIKNYARYKGCSERSFKYHLYKDSRYEGKYSKRKAVNLIPVMVDAPRSEIIRINGFNIDISSTTGEDALAKVLGAIRRIS